MDTILVTGAAGFIGSSLVDRLLADGKHGDGMMKLTRGGFSRLDGMVGVWPSAAANSNQVCAAGWCRRNVANQTSNRAPNAMLAVIGITRSKSGGVFPSVSNTSQ